MPAGLPAGRWRYIRESATAPATPNDVDSSAPNGYSQCTGGALVSAAGCWRLNRRLDAFAWGYGLVTIMTPAEIVKILEVQDGD